MEFVKVNQLDAMMLDEFYQEKIVERFMKSSETFRKPGGDVYRKKFWTRRKYK